MTYYGRWTYKFEEAARRGATGAIIVHQTEPAAYGWDTVVNSWSTPQLDHATADGNAGRVAIEGWITESAARSTVRGQRHDARGGREARQHARLSRRAAAEHGERTLRNAIRRTNSHNLAALLPGSQRPDEYLVYMAHWDHLGRLPGLFR